jgi:benzodiazapine receptor
METRMYYLGSILLVLSLGILSGWLGGSAQTLWYQSLEKPSLFPPAWVFGPVWTVLYITLGIALVQIKKERPQLLFLFCLQLLLNFIWTPVFFLKHEILWALIDLILIVIINFYLLIQLKNNKKIFWLILPYNIWLWFACYLNASIVFLNLGH